MWMAYGAARLDTDTEYNKNVGGHITRHAHCRQVIKRTRANQRTRPHMFSPCREGQKRKTIMVSYRGLTRAYRGTGVKEECKAMDMIWIGKRGLHLVMEEEHMEKQVRRKSHSTHVIAAAVQNGSATENVSAGRTLELVVR